MIYLGLFSIIALVIDDLFYNSFPSDRNEKGRASSKKHREWCSNPEAVRQHPELLLNYRLCVHCGECVPVCTTHAFSMDEGTLMFNRSLCDACGECINCCLEDALEIVGVVMTPEQVLGEVLSDEVFYQVSGGCDIFGRGAIASIWVCARNSKRVEGK